MTRAPRRPSGFTLLELLVAMTLLALIAVAASGAVRFGMAVWERGDAVADTATEQRVLQKFLRRQLASARGILVDDGTRTPPVAFWGGARRVEFIADLSSRLAPPGERLIGLELQGGTLGPRPLVLRWVPVGQDFPVLGPEAAREVLLTGVTDLRLRYFGLQDDGRRAWSDTWTGRSGLPDLVEISLSRIGDGTAALPPLIVRMGARG